MIFILWSISVGLTFNISDGVHGRVSNYNSQIPFWIAEKSGKGRKPGALQFHHGDMNYLHYCVFPLIRDFVSAVTSNDGSFVSS